MKGLRGLLKLFFSRTMLCVIIIIIQIYIMIAGMFWFQSLNQFLYMGSIMMSFLMIIVLFNSKEPVEFKNSWILLCCIDPFLGALLYNFTKLNSENRKLMKHLKGNVEATVHYNKPKAEVYDDIGKEKSDFQQIIKYFENTNSYGVYKNTEVHYFSTGEEMFDSLIEELKNAKKFIFMEFFIIDKGYVWDTILEILKRKVKEGVEVRVLYDGMCSIMLLPYSYPKQLAKFGIKAKMFSPIKPLLSTSYNFRDHRKIVSIDGNISFTGGLNLADEYINRIEKFGYWKDVGVKMRGDASLGFTNMFLQMWNYPEKMEEKITKYLTIDRKVENTNEKGYVIPYADGPHLEDNIARNIYLDMLNTATKYVHIMTPYLVLDSEFENALIFAAKKGIDIKIIMPHIPDKKTVFALGRTFYPTLLKAGIKIFEFTPGFSHGKYFVSDDKVASIGSINLDYRSLYLHFECSVLLYKMDAVHDVEKDFNKTMEECEEITIEKYKKFRRVQRFTGHMLRLVAPLF